MSSVYRFPAGNKGLKIIKEASAVSPANNLVRLSKITVDPAQLDAYNAYLKEEIEASMRLEPGVLTLYATADKKQPNKITILEIYADREAYESISKRLISRNTNRELYLWLRNWN